MNATAVLKPVKRLWTRAITRQSLICLAGRIEQGIVETRKANALVSSMVFGPAIPSRKNGQRIGLIAAALAGKYGCRKAFAILETVPTDDRGFFSAMANELGAPPATLEYLERSHMDGETPEELIRQLWKGEVPPA